MRASHHKSLLQSLLLLVSIVVASAAASAQIRIDRKGLLYGNPAQSRTPAIVELDKALEASPEGRKIRDERIRQGSARYSILRSAAMRRIRRVVREIAIELKHDCIVKKGSIRSSPVRPANVTQTLVSRLESATVDEPPAPPPPESASALARTSRHATWSEMQARR